MRNKLSFGQVIVVSRPLWWVTVAAPFIVGGLLAQRELSWLHVIGAIYFTLPYNLLVYGVNDIFDYETDIRNERKNSVAHGKVLSKLKHPSLWRWIIISNVPPIAILVLTGNIESNVFLLMMLFMAFAYSVAGLRYKEIPVIDSLTSAFHYTSPFLYGLFLFSGNQLWVGAFAAFYFWAVGNHAFGAIQDIVPDKDGGIRSIATKLGATKTLYFVWVAYALAVVAPVLSYGPWGLVAAAWITPYACIVTSTFRYRNDSDHPAFKKAWRIFLYAHYVVGGIASMILIYIYKNNS